MGSSTGPNVVQTWEGATIGVLTKFLTRLLEVPVVDKTGLTGAFAFELDFADLDVRLNAPDTGNRIVLRDALRDQLGLVLNRTNGEVSVTVIESAQKPTPD